MQASSSIVARHGEPQKFERLQSSLKLSPYTECRCVKRCPGRDLLIAAIGHGYLEDSLGHAAFLVPCHATMSRKAYHPVLRSLSAHEAVEDLLRNVHRADTAHARLAFFLFLQELPLPVHGSLSMETSDGAQASASPPALEGVGCGTLGFATAMR